MPVLGNSSRTLRGPKKNNVHYHIPRETIDGFTREFLNIAALMQGAFCGLSGGEKSIVFVTRAMFDSLVQRVMGLFALAQYQIWRFGWLVSFIIDKDRLLSQLSFCIIHFLLELILREVKYAFIYYRIFLSDSSGTMIYILLLVLCSNDNQKFFLCSL